MKNKPKKLTLYVVEVRSNRLKSACTELTDCFIGTTIKQCENFIKENKDMMSYEHLWWFVILKAKLNDYSNATEWIATYDWDGNKLDYQPIYEKIEFTHNFTGIAVGQMIYSRDGQSYKVDEIKKQDYNGKCPEAHIWSGGNCLTRVRYLTGHNMLTKRAYFGWIVPN